MKHCVAFLHVRRMQPAVTTFLQIFRLQKLCKTKGKRRKNISKNIVLKRNYINWTLPNRRSKFAVIGNVNGP